MKNASRALRDVQWHTWTCASGWPAQGLPVGTAFCERSRDSTTMAFCDAKGTVMLAPWPMLASGNKVAAGELAAVRFSPYRAREEGTPSSSSLALICSALLCSDLL